MLWQRPSSRTLVLLGLAIPVLLSAGRIVRHGSIPWGWIGVATTGTFVLVGPVTWLARDRLSSDRRTLLGRVGFGVGFLLLALLVLSPVSSTPVADAVVLGVVAGVTLVVLLEETVLPDRLRGLSTDGPGTTDGQSITRRR